MDHEVNRSIVYSTIYLGLVFTTAARIPYNPLYPLTPVKTFFLTYRRKKFSQVKFVLITKFYN